MPEEFVCLVSYANGNEETLYIVLDGVANICVITLLVTLPTRTRTYDKNNVV